VQDQLARRAGHADRAVEHLQRRARVLQPQRRKSPGVLACTAPMSDASWRSPRRADPDVFFLA
jgi:hypothetical protein